MRQAAARLTTGLAFERLCAAALIAFGIYELATNGFDRSGLFIAVLALYAAFYVIGRRCTDDRLTVVALIVAAVVLAVAPGIAGSGMTEIGNLVSSWLFCALALFGGRLVRQRQRHADLADERARRLERDREDLDQAVIAEERARIARELHDVVAHSLSAIVLQAGIHRRAHERADRPEDERATEELFGSIERVGREALVELRLLLGILRKTDAASDLEPRPGLHALDDLFEQVRERGLAVALQITGEASALPPGVELSAYRIVQEALTSATERPDTQRAEVLIAYGATQLELRISDDGPPPAGGDIGPGTFGLIGARERVALYGGALDVGASDAGGLLVQACLPIEYRVA